MRLRTIVGAGNVDFLTRLLSAEHGIGQYDAPPAIFFGCCQQLRRFVHENWQHFCTVWSAAGNSWLSLHSRTSIPEISWWETCGLITTGRHTPINCCWSFPFVIVAWAAAMNPPRWWVSEDTWEQNSTAVGPKITVSYHPANGRICSPRSDNASYGELLISLEYLEVHVQISIKLQRPSPLNSI